MPDPADRSIQFVKGIGPRRAELLSKLGISTLRDAIEYFPRAYKDRGEITPIREVVPDSEVTVRGKIVSVRLKKFFYRRSMVTVILEEEGSQVTCVWFNQPYMRERFKRGMHVIAAGKVRLGKNDEYAIANPETEIVDEDAEETLLNGSRILPVYPLTERLTQSAVRSLVHKALNEMNVSVEEIMPESVITDHRLPEREAAIRSVHFPSSEEELERARRRFIFEEFFFLQMGIALRRKAIRQREKPRKYCEQKGRCDGFIRSLPFKLTSAQRKVLDEIEQDLMSSMPMNRLLQGDVGSGKTVVAVWAMLRAAASGLQSAIMAPTEVLARQHFRKISEQLRGEDLNIVMLIGAATASEKKRLRQLIHSGHIDIVIGTHALFQEKVKFKDLGLIVIDEQHKFGVMQRMRFFRKGFAPDMLVMTATPIPRTLSLTIYGDMDVSILDEMPPGRKPIETRWLRNRDLKKAYNFVRKQVREGRQVYVIYPLVEESRYRDLKSVKKMFQELRKKEFPEFRVGLLYGSMKPEEKERVMLDFRDRKIDVLVSTTVIEVGIDVPNATCIVIENADYFGLSQLHQLRGRVGRSSEQSYCVLVGTPKSQTGRQRLKVLESTTDGFRIAEEDLYLRGTGEFFGTMQSGLPDLKVGDLFRDFEILKVARDEARRVVSGDRKITYKERAVMRRILHQRFAKRFSLVSI